MTDKRYLHVRYPRQADEERRDFVIGPFPSEEAARNYASNRLVIIAPADDVLQCFEEFGPDPIFKPEPDPDSFD